MTYSPFFFNKQALGSAKGTSSNFVNGSGSTINKAMPVSINSSGLMVPVSVSDEALVLALVGLTETSVPNAATGSVMDNGRLEDVSTSLSVGDAIYINYDGTLTNVKPDIETPGFAEGDFIIFIGVVLKNEFDALKKDIKLMISVIGQL